MKIEFQWWNEDYLPQTFMLDDFRVGPTHPVTKSDVFDDFLRRHGITRDHTVEITFGFTHMVVVEQHRTKEFPKPHLAYRCRGKPAGEEICLEVRAVPYLPGFLRQGFLRQQ